jgi:DNA helicase-2/ATP-dependent DNA helicase PcrA
MFKPRPAQRRILNFTQGKMGVSAVPGSGKTHTLSYLASRLIAKGLLNDDQEVLIVTLVNSAVDNFTSRIAGFIHEAGLLPGFGYRVRTLHGLAHDIVRERPDLVGLDNRFVIVDENEADEILRTAAQAWISANPDFISQYSHPDTQNASEYRVKQSWLDLVVDVSGNFIRTAKDFQTTPEMIRERLSKDQSPHPLLKLGFEIYVDYQRALHYRNGIDFDDLIRLALQALLTDPDYLNRLRYRWHYILEDEAQDSSRLQEEILNTLVGETGNWVRVGDPNQAIYETFTTASPDYLKNFLHYPGVIAEKLPNSGRSTLSIIQLANRLIEWTKNEHPNQNLRGALVEPYIEPVPKGDIQPNPPNNPDGIFLASKGYSPEDEIKTIVRSIKQWLPSHMDQTVAVLVSRNDRGAEIVESLKKNNIETLELLRTSRTTRQASGIFATILRYLADPSSPAKLIKTYHRIRFVENEKSEIHDLHQSTHTLLRTCDEVETYLYPFGDKDWISNKISLSVDSSITQELENFREVIRRWLAAAILPIDQLILTIAQDLFANPSDLALAHKFALLLDRAGQNHPSWHLQEFAEELDTITRNERKFMGFTEEESGFNPDAHKGKVVISTIHKAKGLEWDRVYLLSVNNYDFPSGEEFDSYIAEKWFVINHLNLQAETLTRLKALLIDDIPLMEVEEGYATEESRQDYAAERLRLLFVGITRARKELIITWNTGRNNNSTVAKPLEELIRYWRRTHVPSA